MPEIFAQVLLPLALNQAFTYLAECNIEIGDVVRVEFGRKKIWGVVTSVNSNAPREIDLQKIKKILEKNSFVKLSKNHLRFIEKISSYNLANQGLVLRAFIGILNSDKVKKAPESQNQEINLEKFSLKKLSQEQQEISDELFAMINSDEVALIDGITGSGKTEIYFNLISKILKNDSGQILILLPEIALTSQLLLRFEEQFKFKPALWHSKISKKEKRKIFYGIADGSIKVVIGARSALLLPFLNLKLIVVDEEHDSSFKQEDVINFHARDMAIMLAKIEKFPVVLCSATPSLESYVNATSRKYKHFLLQQRFGSNNKIEFVDLRQEKLGSGKFLSKKLKEEIAKNIDVGKQTLLFLNRRGYASAVLCKDCGRKYECTDCDFHLVLHKSKNSLICHHCGHQENFKQECKSCSKNDSLIAIGVGAERIEEEIKNIFPKAKIALITSDKIENFFDVEKIVTEILSDKIDIIIGTQMIAKGYDFPNLTLVGIVDADAMFYSSELRAVEKAYQMIIQIIGRAGRRKESGRVIIQTYDPENFIFRKIVKDNKNDFYDFEIKNRRSLGLPPFSRLTKFEISAFLESDAKDFAKKLVNSFPVDDKILVFGPTPAIVQRVRRRYHFIVNLVVKKNVNLQKLISDVMRNIDISNRVRVKIDIDSLS